MEVSKAMAERSNVVGGWGGVLISVMSEARKEKLKLNIKILGKLI